LRQTHCIEQRRSAGGVISYRAKVRIKGARPVSKSFRRRTDAVKWIESQRTALREGRDFPAVLSRRYTLAEAIDRYEREVLPRKPRTAGYQKPQLAWWRRQLGHLLLADVTAGAISEARARLATEPGRTHRARGPATANRYMAVLSHVLAIADREWEWVDQNPARRLGKLPEPRGRQRFLSAEECNTLLQTCVDLGHADLHDVVLLAMSTGMRRNEILWLRVAQVDIERGLIQLTDTKNGDSRGVPLAGRAHERLRLRVDRCDRRDALLFCGQTGVTPLDIRKPWYAVLKRAGFADLRLHDLRHTAASLLAKGGASLQEVGAVLGHKSPAMTKRYTHFAVSHVQKIVADMNSEVFPHVP
jgi:integrase